MYTRQESRRFERLLRGCRASAFAALVLASGLGAEEALAQGLPAGEIVVVDLYAGTDQRGALFRVNPATGNRTLVSDFGNPAQGPLGLDPFVVAFAPVGIVVADQRAGTSCNPISGCGAIFVVDPTTGARTLLSDFGDPAQGPTGLIDLYGIVAEASGDLLVTDQSAGGSGQGLLFRVSPADGTRTIVSNFADPGQGPTGGEPSGVAIEASGTILVADANTSGFPSGVIFRIDPQTGQRTIVSDFLDGAQGPLGELPIDVQPGFGNDLWVPDQTGGAGAGYGQLFRVDAITGNRTIVSTFGSDAEGPIGYNQNDVKLDRDGRLLVLDFDAGTNSQGALFEVDPATGARSYFSDFGDPSQGALGFEPTGFAVAPEPPAPLRVLTVQVQGAGSGLVVSEPPAIDCGSDCSELYLFPQTVALAALIGPNSRFAGWTGDPDCADGEVTMDADRTCIANFAPKGKRIILAPDLVPEAEYGGGVLVVPESTELDRTYRVIANVVNRGVLAAGPSVARAYLSRDRKVSADDVFISEQPIAALPPGPSSTSAYFGPGPLGGGLFSGLQGRYYVIVVVDATGLVDESDERNNIGRNQYDFPCGRFYLFSAFCLPR